MQTGENDQAMRKILDMTRLISMVVLILHFYKECYAAFAGWHFVATLTDRLLENIIRTGLFSNFYKAKLIALGFLMIALIGVQGKKDEKQTFKTAGIYMLTGLVFYFHQWVNAIGQPGDISIGAIVHWDHNTRLHALFKWWYYAVPHYSGQAERRYLQLRK